MQIPGTQTADRVRSIHYQCCYRVRLLLPGLVRGFCGLAAPIKEGYDGRTPLQKEIAQTVNVQAQLSPEWRRFFKNIRIFKIYHVSNILQIYTIAAGNLDGKDINVASSAKCGSFYKSCFAKKTLPQSLWR
jgi:hypothetical protein